METEVKLDKHRSRHIAKMIWRELKEGGSLGVLRVIVEKERWAFVDVEALNEYMEGALVNKRREGSVFHDFLKNFSGIPPVKFEKEFAEVFKRNEQMDY